LRLKEKVEYGERPRQGRNFQIFDVEVCGLAVYVYRSGNAGEPIALVAIQDSTLAENAWDDA